MPVYPGTIAPVISDAYQIDSDGFYERKITFFSHTGTHLDTPAHLIKGAKTLDQFPMECFIGKAFVFNFTHVKKPIIELSDLESLHDTLKEVDFVLLHTGWSEYWDKKDYFMHYPVLSVDAAQWLIQFGLKGIGMDTISADRTNAPGLPIHKILLRSNTLIFENLAHLDKIPQGPFLFSCFPLKFEHADGSPVRAVAMVE
jgi:kynurenine formamidase